jgi:hypothetical protein
MSRAVYVASSIAGSNSDRFLPVWTPEGGRLCNPAPDYRISGKIWSRWHKGRCRYVKGCSRITCGRLPWNGRRPLHVTVVVKRRPWFDHFIAYATSRQSVSWKLNLTRKMMYNILDFSFIKYSHYGELVHKSRFIPYMSENLNFESCAVRSVSPMDVNIMGSYVRNSQAQVQLCTLTHNKDAVQTGSGVHPASYPMGTEGVKLTAHLQLVPRSRKYGPIHPLPHTPS